MMTRGEGDGRSRFFARAKLAGALRRNGRLRAGGGGFANTLSGRLAARFADMAAALDIIGLLLAGEPPPPDALAAKSPAPGEGFAAVESARGKSVSPIRLDGAGRIVDYSIVAPTEWNFHPDGPFRAVAARGGYWRRRGGEAAGGEAGLRFRSLPSRRRGVVGKRPCMKCR